MSFLRGLRELNM